MNSRYESNKNNIQKDRLVVVEKVGSKNCLEDVTKAEEPPICRQTKTTHLEEREEGGTDTVTVAVINVPDESDEPTFCKASDKT